MKHLLVTGACGFIGSAFVNTVLSQYPDATVVNADALYACATPRNVEVPAGQEARYTFVQTNLQDVHLLLEVLMTHRIDTVVHFAAQSHVDGSFANPLQYTMDNVVGTHTLLEACRRYQEATQQLDRFLHISTDEVYGESQLDDAAHEAKTELSLTCPTNPYAATKLGAEALVQAYRASYKLPVIVSRSNNVYGPRQYVEKVIPRFIQLLHQGQKCTIHGDGRHVRAFLYVDDVVRALLTILEKGSVGEVYNVGSTEEISVRELAERLVGIIKGPEAPVDQHVETTADRLFNDRRYFISAAKLRQLGWAPTVTLDAGLRQTVAWYTQTIDLATYWARTPAPAQT